MRTNCKILRRRLTLVTKQKQHGIRQSESTFVTLTSGKNTTSKPKVAAAKHKQPTSQIAAHPTLRRPTADRVPTTWRSDNTPHLESHHRIHIRTSAHTVASNTLDEKAERPHAALKLGTTGTMSNIKIRTATVISPHRRLLRSLTQSLILITQGGSTHFRLISQRTRQIQGRHKLRKFRKCL